MIRFWQMALCQKMPEFKQHSHFRLKSVFVVCGINWDRLLAVCG